MKDIEFIHGMNAFQKHLYRGIGFSHDKAQIYDIYSVYKPDITSESYTLWFLSEQKKIELTEEIL